MDQSISCCDITHQSPNKLLEDQWAGSCIKTLTGNHKETALIEFLGKTLVIVATSKENLQIGRNKQKLQWSRSYPPRDGAVLKSENQNQQTASGAESEHGCSVCLHVGKHAVVTLQNWTVRLIQTFSCKCIRQKHRRKSGPFFKSHLRIASFASNACWSI